MIKVGDWIKTSESSTDYVKITKINENDSKLEGYLYEYYNKYAKKIELDLRYVVKVSPEDVLEKVFDEVHELRDEVRELKESIENIKMDLR
jgi:hypothetical protein